MQTQHNCFIDALSPEDRARLLKVATHVKLRQTAVLFEPDEPHECAYFLTSGIASQVVSVKDGSAEIMMQGTEGIIGGMALLGGLPPLARCSMQTDGTALRVPIADMHRLFNDLPELRGFVLESLQQQMLTQNQITACNTLHRAPERLSRWLLTAADRTGSDTIRLTQASLATMLGTRRTTVALVAGALQRSGMIRYRRGVVRILDRTQLEDAACDCYGIVSQMVETLYRDRNSESRHVAPAGAERHLR